MDPSQAADLFRSIFGGGQAGATDFENVFGGQRRRGARNRQAAPEREFTSTVNIPFVTAALGGQVTLQIDDRIVTVKVPGDVPAWQAVEEVCKAAGLVEVFKHEIPAPTKKGRNDYEYYTPYGPRVDPPPTHLGKAVRIYYITQVGTHPPRFAAITNHPRTRADPSIGHLRRDVVQSTCQRVISEK